jgi:acetolactate synthase regulatory subunit
MQWLLTLEIEDDPISLCRLMNIFRRKGVKLGTLGLSAEADGYSVVAAVETAESAVDHIFHFLRRSEGVRHVTCYRHEASSEATFIFVDAGQDASNLARTLNAFPGSKVIFASHRKFLLETPGASQLRAATSVFSGSEFLPLAQVRSTRAAPLNAPVAVIAS